jgi:hypothetical protein
LQQRFYPVNFPAPSVFRNISPRKLILAGVLICSIVVFLLILLAGGVAILHEAAPRNGNAGVYGTMAAVKRVIIHHFIPHFIPHHHR